MTPASTPDKLTFASNDLAACVSCGLCLPHCPTFRVSGDETRSPRGRISAMRGLVAGHITFDDDVVAAMESCVQCRGCETACPSAVPFGTLMTETRRAIAAGPKRRSARLVRIGLRLLAVGWLLRAATRIAAVGQRVGVVPSRRLGLPRRLPLRQPSLGSTGADVWLFTGCVMDAWQRSVHADAIAVATATGSGVQLSPSGGCCGALAEHSGSTRLAVRQAEQTMASMPGDALILVDAAGCGAMLKSYGELVGTSASQEFSTRVRDICEWLAPRMEQLPPVRADWSYPTVAIQDPCHLRHVQRAHLPARTVLGNYATLVEVDDDGMCCGAGGAFSVAQPAMADHIRARKLDALKRCSAGVVASANPGCSIHLGWAGVSTRHPVSIVADALGLQEDGHGR